MFKNGLKYHYLSFVFAALFFGSGAQPNGAITRPLAQQRSQNLQLKASYIFALKSERVGKAIQESSAPAVTPVSGPSWIQRIGINQPSRSAMGRMGGLNSVTATSGKQPNLQYNSPKFPGRGHMGQILRRIYALFRRNQNSVSELMNEKFVLTGADLYRLNCQSCHGPDGTGSPPEIKSIIDPVRGMSPTLTQKRMEKLGREIDLDFARELAKGAEESLRERLRKGGEKMPSFQHLRGDEVEALLGYLKELAGLPKSERKEITVTQSVARAGEHVVKGTCHICHNATGPGGGHMAMMRGIIPSLASFPREMSMQQVIRQVQWGSSGMMRMMGSDLMPKFPYLTEEEIAAAYLYLQTYPPRN